MKWRLVIEFTGQRPAVQRLSSLLERNLAKACDFLSVDVSSWSVELLDESERPDL